MRVTIRVAVHAVSFGSASECKSAASAAARAFLMNSFKREGVEKGIALCQVMAQKFRPRGVPMALVHDILGVLHGSSQDFGSAGSLG